MERSSPQEVTKPAPTYIRTESSASSDTPYSVDEKYATQGQQPQAQSLLVNTNYRQRKKRFGFIRYTALNVYHRLFSLAFIGNDIAFVILMAKGAAPLDLVNTSAVNLAVYGLCRHPLVINALFLTFNAVPRSLPIRLRQLACKIFRLGGVNSGTGVASCVWYIGLASLYQYNFKPSPISIAVLVLVWLVLALLLAIIVAAHPAFRAKYHDYFEFTNRFSN
ncbi:hypothetical protein DL767_001710 [Monosporascus sp. MG133]|nr:hypothetical protein DL767_001710 [Monosporascus sp. MG133]